MNFFYWNKRFEIGHEKIDAQHRHLVGLINNLAVGIAGDHKLPEKQALLGELIEYAATHFRDEESLMEASSLTEAAREAHRTEHRRFVQEVAEIARQPDLAQPEVASRALEFLTAWLVFHILRSDLDLGRALVAEKPGGADGAGLFDMTPGERALICALSETERRFRLISDHTPALIWVSDATGAREFFNRTWFDFVGLADDQAQPVGWESLIHPDDRDLYQHLVASAQAEQRAADVEYRLRKYNGNDCWILERILPRFDEDGTFLGLIAAGTDISALKRAEALMAQSNRELEHQVARRTAQIEQLMLTDSLTGIGNRRMLTSRLADEIVSAQRTKRPMAVAFFDIDHFKCVNDSYGHAVGDLALCHIADTLRMNLREYDVIARFGGEEFVTLFLETDLDQALPLAERIRIAVSELAISEIPEGLTISAGLTAWREGDTAGSLLRRADRALYGAKEAGRNRCNVARD